MSTMVRDVFRHSFQLSARDTWTRLSRLLPGRCSPGAGMGVFLAGWLRLPTQSSAAAFKTNYLQVIARAKARPRRVDVQLSCD